MAEAAVTFLLEQVKEVAIGNKDLISGAEDELNQLNNDLGLLKAFLMDVAKTKKQEYMFKELESQIKYVVYEIEDTIDTCLTKAITAKAKSSIRFRLGSSQYNLAKEIKIIRENKVLPIIQEANRRSSMMQTADGSNSIQRRANERVNPIRQNRVVGFEEEETTITSYLMEPKETLDVIPIIGIPGHGKTTLALKIYQNESIDYHFPIRIWVNVSQKFNIRDLLNQILKKFIPSQDASNLSNDEWIEIVRGCLEKEKFLLVLDDLWSVNAWMEIKQLLPQGNGRAKVLITSREMAVGVHSSVFRKPHVLRFLDEEESWTLLQYEVFGNLEDCPLELRDIGKHVAKECDGVPLTIVLAGGILTILSSIVEWEMMAKKISDALRFSPAERTIEIVASSYDILPDDLRQCFLFLGVFPDGYEIPAKTLCRLWIAEGFIRPKTGISLEQSADENLNDLISRNLLKVEKLNHLGKVKKCKVHDMVRAFCIMKSKEENLFHEIEKSYTTGALFPPDSEVKKFHRLCLHSDLPMFLSETPSGPSVRSLLCFYSQPVKLGPEHISVITEKFPNLRILESKSILFDQFPAKVTTLIHLRYLTLFVDNLRSIPASITQIWNLQALVVKTKYRTITMEANLWKMIRLRYLNTKAAIVLDSKWEGAAGHNLQTLNRLSPESCTEAVCKKAKHLKTLGISGKLAIIFKTNFLEEFHHLERLKLENSSTYESSSEDMLHDLPRSNCFPPNLKRLTLANTFLGWKHMSTLAMIKSLESLKLKDNAFVGVVWNVGRDNFPNLQILLIVNTDLVLWDPSTNNFPSLRCLVVKNCHNLREIPECLGTNLQKLEIDRVRSSVVESARNIAETKMKFPIGKYEVPLDLVIGPDCFIK